MPRSRYTVHAIRRAVACAAAGLLAASLAPSPIRADVQCNSVNGPHINGSRFCPSEITVYAGTGVNSCGTNATCIAWKTQIALGVDAWNDALAGQLSNGLTLSYSPDNVNSCSNCIVFQRAAFGFSDLARTNNAGPISGGWRNTVQATIKIDNDRAFTANERNTTVLHELGHALGLGHDCTGLMHPTSTAQGIDGRSVEVLKCIYGSPDCPSPLSCTCDHFGLDATQVSPSDVQLLVPVCKCAACSGPAPTGPEARAGATPHTLKFLVNDNGGPFTEFATVSDDDLGTERVFNHSFGPSYENAMIRLEVYDGATLVDESEILYPLTIVGVGAVADRPAPKGLSVAAYPNPFSGETTVSFDAATAGHALVTVFDVGGRVVATLYEGAIAPGRHTVSWTGRSNGGRSVAPGSYRCVVSVDGLVGAAAILKLR